MHMNYFQVCVCQVKIQHHQRMDHFWATRTHGRNVSHHYQHHKNFSFRTCNDARTIARVEMKLKYFLSKNILMLSFITITISYGYVNIES